MNPGNFPGDLRPTRINTPEMTDARVRLILEMEENATSPRGQLIVEGQPPRAFSGWLQLGEAIEAAMTVARESRPTLAADLTEE